MKKTIHILSWFLGTCLCIGACSDKDDGTVTTSSVLHVYGQNYNLNSGVIWKNNRNVMISTVPYVYKDTYINEEGQQQTDEITGYSAGRDRQETGNFMLSLYEPGLVFDNNLESITGRGACICFHLSSPDTEKLIPGKYTFGKEKLPNTFTAYSSVFYDTQKSVDPAEITKGEIIIEKNSDTYHIEFNTLATNGAKITGQFDGTLKECKVKQLASANYDNVSIAGLLDSIYTIVEQMGIIFPTEWGLDESNGAAFYSTTTGTSNVATNAKNVNVDIALLWDRKTESFIFESPIRMRSWLGHNDNYNLPCHTIYMKAPDSFTDTDFEKLDDTGFSFDIEEQKVIFNTQTFQPGYVFFETGNGIQGVIHVKRFTPTGSKREDFMGMGFLFITTPVNPTLIMDIKCPANFIDPKIR